MSPVIAFFGLILALYLAWRAYHAIKDYIHESRLHPIIPFTRRHLVVPAHGQRVQLSPAEASMARAALEFHGAMRITVVAMLSGPDIEGGHWECVRVCCASRARGWPPPSCACGDALGGFPPVSILLRCVHRVTKPTAVHSADSCVPVMLRFHVCHLLGLIDVCPPLAQMHS